MTPIIIQRDYTPHEDSSYILGVVFAPPKMTDTQARDRIKEVFGQQHPDADDDDFLRSLEEQGFTIARHSACTLTGPRGVNH